MTRPSTPVPGVRAAGVLGELVHGAVEDAQRRLQDTPLAQVRLRAADAEPARDAVTALRRGDPGAGVRVVAEVKRASPSKGALADIPDPAGLAATYAAAGAAAISVLTEGRRFGGSLADLDAVRQRVDVPVLRKDFVVSEHQVLESRAHGADLVLLIVAALEQGLLAHLHGLVGELGMSALVEVHDHDETERAVTLGARLIGVNNRDLTTLDVDPRRFATLAPALLGAEDRVLVAESGIREEADVADAVRAGADAVLVGEALVRSGDPARTLAALSGAGTGQAGARAVAR